MSENLVGVKNSYIEVTGKSKEKNGAEAFVFLCENTNYIAFEDYSKFGHLNLGRAVHWRQGDFYIALQKLDAESSDIGDENRNPRLCKESKRYLPCMVKDQQIIHNTKFEVGDQTRYFKKTRSGHWGFRYDKMKKFMKTYGTQIGIIVDAIEADRAEQADMQKKKRELAKERKCTLGELEVQLVKEMYMLTFKKEEGDDDE